MTTQALANQYQEVAAQWEYNLVGGIGVDAFIGAMNERAREGWMVVSHSATAPNVDLEIKEFTFTAVIRRNTSPRPPGALERAMRDATIAALEEGH